MTSTTLFKKCDILWKEVQEKTENHQRTEPDFFKRTETILMEADEALRQLKSWVHDHEFSNWEEEIRFFKTIKPQFTALFMYHSRLLSVEAACPYGDDAALHQFYDRELKALHYFFTEHQEFIGYYRRNATYMDRKYFLRNQYDLKVRMLPDFHNYDHRFSTSHDMVLAGVIAYDELELTLKNKIRSITGDPALAYPSKAPALKWTGNKASLIELLAALHHSGCFNGGHADLAEIVR